MTIKLNDIKDPIREEMASFEVKFRSYMKSDIMLLDRIMGYIVKRKGKQIRPMFVFLSAGVFGEINEATYRGAALIELLHTLDARLIFTFRSYTQLHWSMMM